MLLVLYRATLDSCVFLNHSSSYDWKQIIILKRFYWNICAFPLDTESIFKYLIQYCYYMKIESHCDLKKQNWIMRFLTMPSPTQKLKKIPETKTKKIERFYLVVDLLKCSNTLTNAGPAFPSMPKETHCHYDVYHSQIWSPECCSFST